MAFVILPDTDRPRKHQVILAGVRYDITVSQFSNKIYRASWTCSKCNEQGPWAPLSAEPKQAAAMAKVALEVHHAFVHQHGPWMAQKPNKLSGERHAQEKPAPHNDRDV